IIEEEELVKNSRKIGEVMLQGFKKLQKELDIVGDVRAIGLLGAVELVEDQATNKCFAPDLQVAPKVIEALHKRGVICRPVTYEATALTCCPPPWITTERQINTMIDKLYDAIKEVREGLSIISK